MSKDNQSLVVRLQGGFRMWWTTITPTVAGHISVIDLPDVFSSINFHWRPVGGLGGHWDVWPINNPARPHPLQDVTQLSHPVQLTARTLGVALISLRLEEVVRTGPNIGWLWIELFLSETEPAQDGRSVYEDWVYILKHTKDSESREALLTLNFSNVLPEALLNFENGRKLVTSNLELAVRPRSRAADPD